MDFLIVTGISGAGKTQTSHILEDIGFYCVDNIPPKLLKAFYDICTHSYENYRVAVVVDVRSGDEFNTLFEMLKEIQQNDLCRILFLEASNEELLRRYRLTRRKHPLLDAANGSLEAAIEMERRQLSLLKENAYYIIDTTFLSNAKLKERLSQLFLEQSSDAMRVHVMSFGYKYGLPAEADLVLDMRGLPNPFYVPELKAHSGLEEAVRNYVLKWPETKGCYKRMKDFIDYMMPLYVSEGRSQMVIAIGCTGGRHRSVVMAQELYQNLRDQGKKTTIAHRDVDR